MTNIKKIIICVSIIIVLLITIILTIVHFNKGEVIYKIDETGTSDDEIDDVDTSLQYVTVRNDFYAIQTCVQKFYSYYTAIFDGDNINFEDDESADDKKIKADNEEAVYNMLDTEYVNYKNITKNNISNKLDKLNESIVNINEMYVSKKNTNVYVYIVIGRLREVQSGNMTDFKIMIKNDALNKTFSVYLEDYINEKLNDLEIGKEVNLEVGESVEDKEINIYDYSIITDEVYATDLMEKYKEEILFDEETAYSNLDEEYRKKRFENLDNFKEYAKENVIKNVSMEITKYQKNNYDDYTEYVCMDQDGNYYIFNEFSTMNYKMVLDTYTINLPTFDEKYDKSEPQIKVGMNIEKVINAINQKDYKYVYNKLDETFRNNNFGNLNVFSEFMKNNFFDNNEVTYKEFSNTDDIYTYTININDADSIGNVKKFIIIMKLLDNRDFVMSFSFE